MAKIELIMPKMGESVAEATIISWHKEIGDFIELDETVVEIATDKVDSEVPSTTEGKLVEKLFEADQLVKVGEVFAIVETEGEDSIDESTTINEKVEFVAEKIEEEIIEIKETISTDNSESERFYSPLVKSIASQEGIQLSELDLITGTGKENRLTKNDLLSYLKNKSQNTATSKVDKKYLKSKLLLIFL